MTVDVSSEAHSKRRESMKRLLEGLNDDDVRFHMTVSSAFCSFYCRFCGADVEDYIELALHVVDNHMPA